jgi:hypothetical protein|tara:strand:- start:196 stop:450 length:255 start_codon:yes stop_codon:yes gene_type:complete
MVKTVGDLFEENDDWVNDEEAVALERIVELKRDYIKDNVGKRPTTLHINIKEELSSYMLWFAAYYGLHAQLTEGETHICGQSVN